ncbi:hypothetical protein ACFYNN_07495 [Streptomyces sp. NPDC006978]|uniref:hypothetical protein n=1 Tax=unclassified Streptomyces TaxID=2593676 RepID=UPI002AFEDB0B|nr:hypothetical protein [Streptomyces sp. S584]
MARPVRTESAGHPVGTVASHRQQKVKDQVSDARRSSPQVADAARYQETKKA